MEFTVESHSFPSLDGLRKRFEYEELTHDNYLLHWKSEGLASRVNRKGETEKNVSPGCWITEPKSGEVYYLDNDSVLNCVNVVNPGRTIRRFNFKTQTEQHITSYLHEKSIFTRGRFFVGPDSSVVVPLHELQSDCQGLMIINKDNVEHFRDHPYDHSSLTSDKKLLISAFEFPGKLTKDDDGNTIDSDHMIKVDFFDRSNGREWGVNVPPSVTHPIRGNASLTICSEFLVQNPVNKPVLILTELLTARAHRVQLDLVAEFVFCREDYIVVSDGSANYQVVRWKYRSDEGEPANKKQKIEPVE